MCTVGWEKNREEDRLGGGALVTCPRMAVPVGRDLEIV